MTDHLSQSGARACAYCAAITTLYQTGRRLICRECFITQMGEAPPEPPVGAEPEHTPRGRA